MKKAILYSRVAPHDLTELLRSRIKQIRNIRHQFFRRLSRLLVFSAADHNSDGTGTGKVQFAAKKRCHPHRSLFYTSMVKIDCSVRFRPGLCGSPFKDRLAQI